MRVPLPLLALGLATACDDNTGPPAIGEPGITVLTGAGQADTIDALLPVPLTIEIRDADGRIARGTVVQFLVLPDSAPWLAGPAIAPFSGGTASDAAFELTTDAGLAGVHVRLGSLAGEARILISVPSLGWSDTAAFTVVPGNPLSLTVAPRDTTVPAGATLQLRAAALDRHGNAILAAPTFTMADGSGATVSGTGLLNATSEGRWQVVTTVPQLSPDTSHVNVFPVEGTLVVAVPMGVAIVEMDGTLLGTIPVPLPGPQGRYPTWISETAIVAQDGQSHPELLHIDVNGTVTHLLQDTGSTSFELWPQASRDGAWIHFAGKAPNASTSSLSLWRIRPNGTDLQRVSPPNTPGQSETCPSPSPDGSRVVATTTRFGGSFTLAVIDVASQNLSPTGVVGIQPRWAPAGENVAFLGGPTFQQVWIMDASTGVARRVSPIGRSYSFGIEWTPSQAWLIARSVEGLELINVATGDIVPLNGFPTGAYQPAIRP